MYEHGDTDIASMIVSLGGSMAMVVIRDVPIVGPFRCLKEEVEDILLDTQVDQLRIIPAGPTAMFPAELLGSKRMEELLATLRQYFDYILIDTPPIRAVADFYVLSRYTDVNVFVVRNNFTKAKYVEGGTVGPPPKA